MGEPGGRWRLLEQQSQPRLGVRGGPRVRGQSYQAQPRLGRRPNDAYDIRVLQHAPQIDLVTWVAVGDTRSVTKQLKCNRLVWGVGWSGCPGRTVHETATAQPRIGQVTSSL
jgi:hypothetical protein